MRKEADSKLADRSSRAGLAYAISVFLSVFALSAVSQVIAFSRGSLLDQVNPLLLPAEGPLLFVLVGCFISSIAGYVRYSWDLGTMRSGFPELVRSYLADEDPDPDPAGRAA